MESNCALIAAVIRVHELDTIRQIAANNRRMAAALSNLFAITLVIVAK
jgi:hypothetical protein